MDDLGEGLEGRELFAAPLRRRLRKGQAVHAQDEAEDGAEPKRVSHPAHLFEMDRLRRGLGGGVTIQQPLPDSDSDRDPADRAPHAHLAEVAVAVGQMMEGQGVGQGERRGVQQGVKEREHEQRIERGELRKLPYQNRAQDVAEGEEFFGVEITIGDLSGNKRGDQCAGRSDRRKVADL